MRCIIEQFFLVQVYLAAYSNSTFEIRVIDDDLMIARANFMATLLTLGHNHNSLKNVAYNSGWCPEASALLSSFRNRILTDFEQRKSMFAQVAASACLLSALPVATSPTLRATSAITASLSRETDVPVESSISSVLSELQRTVKRLQAELHDVQEKITKLARTQGRD